MTCREDPQVQTQRNPLPRRLQRDHSTIPTQEEIREIRQNLTGFFALLREWAGRTEKARPPPEDFIQPPVIPQIIESK